MKKGTFSRTDIHTVWMHDDLFEFIQTDPPFFYTASDGAIVMPPPRLVTDFGSIPPAVRWLLNPVEYAPCYVNHDCLYQFARVNCAYRLAVRPRMRSRGVAMSGGLFPRERPIFREYDSIEYEPVGGSPINRWYADWLLSEMIYTLTGNADFKRWCINVGLAAGGFAPWNSHADGRPKSAPWYWGDKR